MDNKPVHVVTDNLANFYAEDDPSLPYMLLVRLSLPKSLVDFDALGIKEQLVQVRAKDIQTLVDYAEEKGYTSSERRILMRIYKPEHQSIAA